MTLPTPPTINLGETSALVLKFLRDKKFVKSAKVFEKESAKYREGISLIESQSWKCAQGSVVNADNDRKCKNCNVDKTGPSGLRPLMDILVEYVTIKRIRHSEAWFSELFVSERQPEIRHSMVSLLQLLNDYSALREFDHRSCLARVSAQQAQAAALAQQHAPPPVDDSMGMGPPDVDQQMVSSQIEPTQPDQTQPSQSVSSQSHSAQTQTSQSQSLQPQCSQGQSLLSNSSQRHLQTQIGSSQ
eukprot:962687_1